MADREASEAVTATDMGAGDAGGPIVMELDRELRHVRASEAALALVGLPAEALVGRTPSEAGLPPEVVEPLEEALRRVVASGRPRQLELRMPTVEGVRWLHLRLVPAGAGQAGQGGAVSVLATDITERKRTELLVSGGSAAFRTLVQDSPDPIARLDAELRVIFVNSAFELATGHPAAAFLGRAIGDSPLPAGVAARCEQAARRAVAGGEPVAIDFHLDAPDGARWYSARMLPELEPGRPVANVIVACTDVTERVNREAEQAALRRVATVVAREGDLAEIARVVAQEAAMLLNASGSAVYRFASDDEAVRVAAHPPTAPDVAARLTLTEASATGQVSRAGRAARVDDYAAGPRDASIEELLAGGLRSTTAAPLWVGGRLWGALTASSERAGAFGPVDDRRLAAFAELAAIAVANAEARAELARLADTDPLTGLANRRAFTARLAGEVERARRHGHRLTLAVLDLDDFKAVNDTGGHEAGDRLLAEVGARLQRTSRAGELVARVGGEEFAWILPEVDARGSLPAVERARREIAAIALHDGRSVTCSAGVCDLAQAGDGAALMREADRALYRAKAAGRDRVVVAGS